MNRILGIVSAMLLASLILVPGAAAADPFHQDGRFIMNVQGDMTFPAGQHADSLVVVDGTATIEGDVDSIVVINGSVRLIGAQAGEIVAIASDVSLDATSVVIGDIRVFSTTVTQAAGASVEGQIRQGFAWFENAVWIGPALLIAYLGLVLVALAGGLALAGLTGRQVRAAQDAFRQEAGAAIVAGFGGIFAIVTVAILAMVTVVGIPLGFVLLVGLLPFLLFVGYVVAGIWVGEWIVGRNARGPRPERPYLAATVGILAISAVSIVPGLGGLFSFVGLGAVCLLMWRSLRGEARSVIESAPVAAHVAG